MQKENGKNMRDASGQRDGGETRTGRRTKVKRSERGKGEYGGVESAPEGMWRGSGCASLLPVSGLTIKLLAQLRYASRDVDANGDPTRTLITRALRLSE